ncbi:MAG: methyltransferase domain-containing protein [Acidobacteria bacterium]|nr:methyltransferase domain-containing protein [Acidobacteriota bacterium]
MQSLKAVARQVVGIDHDQDCIADAGQLRKLYDLPNLSFRLADLMKINEKEFDKFDIVLMMGLLSSLENPIAGLRKAAALTKRMLLIETEVLSNHTEISRQPQERFKGAFGLIEAPENSGGFSLLPSTESLIWLLKQTGFHRVDVLPPPADACEELKSGNRVFIAAYI